MVFMLLHRSKPNLPIAMINPRRSWPKLAPRFLTLLAALLACAPLRAQDAVPQKIDVKSLNYRVEDVVVPVPSEIFNALNKLGGNLNWAAEVRKNSAARAKERPQIALMLGTVIANGFIAVQARDGQKVKDVGRRVLELSQALSVRDAVLSHCQSIIDAADKENWTAVRAELDKAQGSVRTAMDRLKDKDVSELISIGGWLRGTESLTSLVKQNYTAERAELLHQPDLLDTFDRQLNAMNPKVRANPLVNSLQKGLAEMRPLITVGGDEQISQKSVETINGISSALVKSISPP
jgi:hypothetical protein